MEAKNISFENSISSLPGKAADAVSDLTNSVSTGASAFKERAQELGRTTVDKIDENRTAVAGSLRGAASALHNSADRLPDVPGMAHTAARHVDSIAEYMEGRDTRQFARDLTAVVKRNPMPSLIIAGIAGFLIGRTIRNSN